jgi:hypothetical protein
LADIKLFQIQSNAVRELRAESVDIEKSLQSLMEQHLEAFLGVRFVASEYITGKVHGGRIDTLGLDDNNCPVIIEYKRALNENVISQGQFRQRIGPIRSTRAKFSNSRPCYGTSRASRAGSWSRLTAINEEPSMSQPRAGLLSTNSKRRLRRLVLRSLERD